MNSYLYIHYHINFALILKSIKIKTFSPSFIVEQFFLFRKIKKTFILGNIWFMMLCWLMPESPLNSKEIKPINLKGNQLWIFIGRNDVEAEAPILWPPGVKSQFIQKDPDAWENWGREEKGATENKIAAWHHQLNGYEFEQTLGDREGQGSLACCSPCGRKELDTT